LGRIGIGRYRVNGEIDSYMGGGPVGGLWGRNKKEGFSGMVDIHYSSRFFLFLFLEISLLDLAKHVLFDFLWGLGDVPVCVCAIFFPLFYFRVACGLVWLVLLNCIMVERSFLGPFNYECVYQGVETDFFCVGGFSLQSYF